MTDSSSLDVSVQRALDNVNRHEEEHDRLLSDFYVFHQTYVEKHSLLPLKSAESLLSASMRTCIEALALGTLDNKASGALTKLTKSWDCKLDLLALFNGCLTSGFIDGLKQAQKSGYKAKDFLPKVIEVAKTRRTKTNDEKRATRNTNRSMTPQFKPKDIDEALRILADDRTRTKLYASTTPGPIRRSSVDEDDEPGEEDESVAIEQGRVYQVQAAATETDSETPPSYVGQRVESSLASEQPDAGEQSPVAGFRRRKSEPDAEPSKRRRIMSPLSRTSLSNTTQDEDAKETGESDYNFQDLTQDDVEEYGEANQGHDQSTINLDIQRLGPEIEKLQTRAMLGDYGISTLLDALVPVDWHVVDATFTKMRKKPEKKRYQAFGSTPTFQLPKTVLPMCDGAHWIWYEIQQESIVLYNSWRADTYNSDQFAKRIAYFCDSFAAGAQVRQWPITKALECPGQDDQESCGLFVLATALLRTSGIELPLHIDPVVTRHIAIAALQVTKGDQISVEQLPTYLPTARPVEPLGANVKAWQRHIQELTRWCKEHERRLKIDEDALTVRLSTCESILAAFEKQRSQIDLDKELATLEILDTLTGRFAEHSDSYFGAVGGVPLEDIKRELKQRFRKNESKVKFLDKIVPFVESMRAEVENEQKNINRLLE